MLPPTSTMSHLTYSRRYFLGIVKTVKLRGKGMELRRSLGWQVLIDNFVCAAELWSEEAVEIKMVVFPSYCLWKCDS